MLEKPFTIGQEYEVTHACETEAAQSSTEKQLENRPPFLKQMKQCVEEKSPENRSACVTQAMQYQQEQNPGNMLPYGAQTMQNPAVRYPEDCYDVRKAVAMEQVKTNGEIVRAAEKERVRLCGAEFRSLKKEEDRERKKAQFEELQVTDTGQIQIVTRNLRIEARPRKITDMTNPSLTVLKRAKNVEEQIFRIEFWVCKRKQKLFLDAEKVGSGTYLVKKFASKGVTFLLPKDKQKTLVVQLISILLSYSRDEELLPEMAGWMKRPDGTYKFIEEGVLTWDLVKKMSK